MSNGFATRWIKHKNLGNNGYTKWHWTEDGIMTLCNNMIPLGSNLNFIPETDDEEETVNCKKCLHKMDI
jgi:hypothetical protein